MKWEVCLAFSKMEKLLSFCWCSKLLAKFVMKWYKRWQVALFWLAYGFIGGSWENWEFLGKLQEEKHKEWLITYSVVCMKTAGNNTSVLWWKNCFLKAGVSILLFKSRCIPIVVLKAGVSILCIRCVNISPSDLTLSQIHANFYIICNLFYLTQNHCTVDQIFFLNSQAGLLPLTPR